MSAPDTSSVAAVATRSATKNCATAPASIGIVVPVHNEAAILEKALLRLRALASSEAVVVVDGGSTDGSLEIARQIFPTTVCDRPSRGGQMDLAAGHLQTDVLLFLHVDSTLPAGFQQAICGALADLRVVGGCFRLEFDEPHPALHFYTWWTRFPGRFFHFGDQAFFVRREVFEQMGGYRGLPFLEDADFLRRLRRFGRFRVLPLTVTTSARRFLRRGIVRQQLRNILLVTLFELGVRPERLARFYPSIR